MILKQKKRRSTRGPRVLWALPWLPSVKAYHSASGFYNGDLQLFQGEERKPKTSARCLSPEAAARSQRIDESSHSWLAQSLVACLCLFVAFTAPLFGMFLCFFLLFFLKKGMLLLLNAVCESFSDIHCFIGNSPASVIFSLFLFLFPAVFCLRFGSHLIRIERSNYPAIT